MRSADRVVLSLSLAVWLRVEMTIVLGVGLGKSHPQVVMSNPIIWQRGLISVKDIKMDAQCLFLAGHINDPYLPMGKD